MKLVEIGRERSHYPEEMAMIWWRAVHSPGGWPEFPTSHDATPEMRYFISVSQPLNCIESKNWPRSGSRWMEPTIHNPGLLVEALEEGPVT